MSCALLIFVVSLDTFVASIAYGSKEINIPFKSTMIINIVSTLFLTFSILLGSQFKRILPNKAASILSFIILLALGVFYLLESIIRFYLGSKTHANKGLEFRMSNIRFIVNVYIDGTSADMDYSKTLDSTESIYLGIALSLDSLAIGFGSGLIGINYLALIFFSLLVGMISVRTGLFIGRHISRNKRIDLSWLAGIILISLAITKLI